MVGPALDAFQKADKQDGGQCLACQRQIIKYALELRDWKAATAAAEEMIAQAKEKKDEAVAHYQLRLLLLEDKQRRKDDPLHRAHEELGRALAIAPKFPLAVLADGLTLAFLKQDEEAKARFVPFVEMEKEDTPERQRAVLYSAQPELARAAMAPPFSVTTLDGKQVSLDDLQGKVVLIDFWATWCGPCREALPHVREIANKFAEQPLIVLSVSVDTDEAQWKELIANNEMTWPPYCDHGFTGLVAKSIGVQAMPNTYTIDADGILRDQHIGDAAIEGKLKKLAKRAQEKQAAKTEKNSSPSLDSRN